MYVERVDEGSYVLHGITWEAYLELDRARGEDAVRPRLAYLDGDLELIMPGDDHELWKKLLARLLEAYAEEREISLNGFGSTTYRNRAKRAGLEPDECYFVGGSGSTKGKVPDLALEVSASRTGVNKLEIYRRLGVSEVWLWEKKHELQVFRLWRGDYRLRPRSVLFPDLDIEDLAKRVVMTDPWQQTESVRAYRVWLRRRNA